MLELRHHSEKSELAVGVFGEVCGAHVTSRGSGHTHHSHPSPRIIPVLQCRDLQLSAAGHTGRLRSADSRVGGFLEAANIHGQISRSCCPPVDRVQKSKCHERAAGLFGRTFRGARISVTFPHHSAKTVESPGSTIWRRNGSCRSFR